jgi:transposase
MSTALLYHMFGITGSYQYQATTYRQGQAIFRIHRPADTLRCPLCGSRQVIRRGVIPRRLRSLPIGSRPTWIELEVQRVWCPHCQKVQQVSLPFAQPFKSYCRALERYVLDLLHYATIQDVARHLQVSWSTIKAIQKTHLQRRQERSSLKGLRQIALDEICVGKGHFLTLVLDLESGAVVFVGEGKSAASLQRFWQRLEQTGTDLKIQAVAMDFSAAYQQAVRENLPDATLVFDHFHLIQLYHQKLTQLRRDLQREAREQLAKAVLTGTRWLLLKNPENLSEQPGRDGRHEKQRLQELLALNQPLAIAYFMKEDLRQFWNQGTKAAAEGHLRLWIAQAQASGIAMLQKFATFLQSHQSGLLAWYDYPISTGPLEGTNNKVKTMQRQAYGYRDHEFFKLKILALHEAKLKLVG